MKKTIVFSSLILLALVTIACITPLFLKNFCDDKSTCIIPYYLTIGLIYLFIIFLLLIVNHFDNILNTKPKVEKQKHEIAKLYLEINAKNEAEINKTQEINKLIISYLEILGNIKFDKIIIEDNCPKNSSPEMEKEKNDQILNSEKDIFNSQLESIKLVIKKLTEKL